ncbi:hypothetical protein [Frigoriflavimonas asaccharolytica]|uniref:Uncharacterized protein n=1 Tax=Frigoriflavimonas asaccharolytica TaxID=2735899 RepID=A0A8J8G8Y5_9FLAO|nr:hypothetical protein [Frigoriflavimonas asaccharolytica]NRS93293.1 hypothetical protein [Frigoriflavimonas asaccharolytica]
MKKLLLLFSLILVFTTGCTTELSERPNGIYVEKSPTEFRTTINFTSDRELTITKIDGTSKDYSFSVGEMIMSLTPKNEATYPSINLFYHYTDPNQFEIGNIYTGDTDVMVFVRPPTK